MDALISAFYLFSQQTPAEGRMVCSGMLLSPDKCSSTTHPNFSSSYCPGPDSLFPMLSMHFPDTHRPHNAPAPTYRDPREPSTLAWPHTPAITLECSYKTYTLFLPPQHSVGHSTDLVSTVECPVGARQQQWKEGRNYFLNMFCFGFVEGGRSIHTEVCSIFLNTF